MDRAQFLPCPVCSSLVIDYTRVQPITDQQVVITQKCEACGHQWDDIFLVERTTNRDK